MGSNKPIIQECPSNNIQMNDYCVIIFGIIILKEKLWFHINNL